MMKEGEVYNETVEGRRWVDGGYTQVYTDP